MTLYEQKVKSGYITLTRTFPLRDIYFLMRGFTFFAIFKLLTLNYFRELKIYKKTKLYIIAHYTFTDY